MEKKGARCILLPSSLCPLPQGNTQQLVAELSASGLGRRDVVKDLIQKVWSLMMSHPHSSPSPSFVTPITGHIFEYLISAFTSCLGTLIGQTLGLWTLNTSIYVASFPGIPLLANSKSRGGNVLRTGCVNCVLCARYRVQM